MDIYSDRSKAYNLDLLHMRANVFEIEPLEHSNELSSQGKLSDC
jgi:hypothetical protein